MLKQLRFGIMAVAIMIFTTANSSSAYFLDWKLDPDGSGTESAFSAGHYLEAIGNNSMMTTTTGLGGSFTFINQGSFRVTGVNGTGELPTAREITGTFAGSGSGTSGGSLLFNSGLFKLYSDSSPDYLMETGDGAGDGDLIGTFLLLSGGLPNGYPDGNILLTIKALELAAGYWFDSVGNDLSSMPALYMTVGFKPDEDPAVNTDSTNGTEIRSTGEYNITAVPEPGTFALIGLGFAALGLSAFSKKSRG